MLASGPSKSRFCDCFGGLLEPLGDPLGDHLGLGAPPGALLVSLENQFWVTLGEARILSLILVAWGLDFKSFLIHFLNTSLTCFGFGGNVKIVLTLQPQLNFQGLRC